MATRKTKQGVRDLNHLPGKSSGKVLDPIPEGQKQSFCKHVHRREVGYYWIVCEDCDESWDAAPY